VKGASGGGLAQTLAMASSFYVRRESLQGTGRDNWWMEPYDRGTQKLWESIASAKGFPELEKKIWGRFFSK